MRYLICTLLIITGLAAYGISTAIDVDFWTGQAVTNLGKIEWGGAAVIFRTVTCLFAAVVAMQFRQKSIGGFGMGLIASVVLIFFMSVGMSSIIGFGGRERIGPSMIAAEKLAAQKSAFETAQLRKKQLEDATITTLRDQIRNAKGLQSRQIAINALDQATFGGTTEVQVAPTRDKLADPQAEFIHQMFPSWSVENIQFASTIAFGVGLILAEMVCVGFGVGLWPKAPEATKSAPAAKSEPLEAVPTPAPELPSATVLPFTRPAQAAIEQPVEEPVEQSELYRDVDDHMTAEEAVAEFWRYGTRPCTSARLGATPVFRRYLAYCERVGLPSSATDISQQMFGRISGRHCERDKSGATYYYLGRSVINDDGEELIAA